MKNIFLLLSIVLSLSVNSFSQQESKNGPVITFDETLVDEKGNIGYNYGTIIQNSNGQCEIKFINTGKQPLVLSKVRSSCGCTVPNWPRQPILPGKQGIIKVKYDTRKLGSFNKSITIESNSKKTISCRIKGKVISQSEASMPILMGTQGATPEAKKK